MELTIDRGLWLRGEGAKASSLLRIDGKMCCLGFWGKAIGGADDQLFQKIGPADVPELSWKESCSFDLDDKQTGVTHSEESKSMQWNEILGRMMQVNDDRTLHDNYREATLTKLFDRIGIEVKFVDSSIRQAARVP